VPDVACPWLDGLYINSGHGSRGLITAPLSGNCWRRGWMMSPATAQKRGRSLPSQPVCLAPLIRRTNAWRSPCGRMTFLNGGPSPYNIDLKRVSGF
jgi:hypothetical protein